MFKILIYNCNIIASVMLLFSNNNKNVHNKYYIIESDEFNYIKLNIKRLNWTKLNKKV